MRFAATLLIAVIACGGAQKPESTGMKELAAELDAELAEFVRIVHAERANCPALAAQLQALFVRMQASIDRAHAAEKDPALAKELTTELRRYDKRTEQHTAAVAKDFSEEPQCANDVEVRKVIMSMPTL